MKQNIRIIMTIIAATTLSSTGWSQEEEPIKLQANFFGDKEQPFVSYFIPWKEIGTPDKLQWDLDSKYDKTLELVDRKILLRSLSMYETMELEKNSPSNLPNIDEAL